MPTLQFKVCGEYCGSNWCSGEALDETACVQGGVWGVPSEPGQCADACCRSHDYCCGTAADRPTCNSKLLACLTSSDCYRSSVCGMAVRSVLLLIRAVLIVTYFRTFAFSHSIAHPHHVLAYRNACRVQTWAAMKIVTNWCCGSKCPVSTMLALETALGLNSTEAAQIRLANEALL